MTNFQFSPEIDPNKIFLVKHSELEGRFDPSYYKSMPKLKGFVSLKQIAEVNGGKRMPKGKTFSDLPTQYKYLRVEDLKEGDVTIKSLKSISRDIFNILYRYEIRENDLVISIAGTIGRIVILKNSTKNRIILTENAAKIRLKSSKITLKALQVILQANLLQRQIQASSIQTTIPKLGLDKILNLKIPIPPKETQFQIVAKMDAAYAAKKQKEIEAQRLLDSIDDYLLGELGIALPEQEDNTIESRMFTRRLSEVSGGRFDPFFSSLNKQDRSGKYKFYTLKKLTHIKKGNSITSDDIVDGSIPVIAGGQASPYNHNTANSDGDVITVSASGAYSGYVWYHESSIFASDCTIISSKNIDELSNKYIFEYLKTEQQNIYNLQHGSGQPHVYPSDLEKIKIPVPPLEKQVEIVGHITVIRNKAKALQQQAKEELEQAKKEVEKMILGADAKSA